MSIPSRPSPVLAGAVLLGGPGMPASALAVTELAQGYALGAQAAPAPSAAATPAQQPQADTETKAKAAAAGDAKAAAGTRGGRA
ncbi:hypothetical protein [Xanthomonas theicola]|nr:hypothetical protein [Xanthomonas theicola]QNH25503.1 hypothetical protein G4Q83_13125 [Xanthomonas theicola]